MKKLLIGILVLFFSVVFLGALLIGFSFVDRGELAQQIAKEIELPIERWEAPRIIYPPYPPGPSRDRDARGVLETEDWEYLNSSAEVISGPIREPRKNLYLLRPISGDVEAKNVKLDSVEVNGGISATEAVIIQGGIVRQTINSKSVQLTSENRQPGIVYGDIKSKDILLGPDTLVYGNVGTEGSQVDSAGTLQGNLTGKQIILRQNAIVHGDVYTTADAIIMEPGAEVRGRFIGLNQGTLKIIKGDPEAGEWGRQNQNRPSYVGQFNGPQNFDNNREVVYVNNDQGGLLGLVLAWLPTLIGIIALVLLAQSFLSKDAATALENITQRPWQSLWIGVLTLLASIPLSFLLAVSIIGIPLAAALGAIITAAAIVGASGVALTVGAKVGNAFGITQDSRLKEALLGTVLLAHLIWIPGLGWFVMGVLLLAGLGGVMMIWWPRFKISWREWRTRRAEAKNNKHNPNPNPPQE